MELPAQPDLARMRRERGARLRAAMADRGVDALVLLGNSNVSYSTGASWPLSDAGRAIAERPVAVVVADDEAPPSLHPVPRRRGRRARPRNGRADVFSADGDLVASFVQDSMIRPRSDGSRL